MLSLVELREPCERHCKSTQWNVGFTGGHRNHAARIATAAQKGTYRNVGNHMRSDGVFERPAKTFDRYVNAGVLVGDAVLDVPVLVNGKTTPLNGEIVAGRELVYSTKNCLRGVGDTHEPEKVPQSVVVQSTLQVGIGEQRLELRGKQQAGAVIVVEQRLDPETIPRQQ